ncbi:MAG: YggS family pyridoxal phosphate-dependent enzyme [candidate division Zixibacteria bacterium]|nr:YggS family pyridoxal phosphate-dependent enzyme [candidate division Zixibacteria bacterium]
MNFASSVAEALDAVCRNILEAQKKSGRKQGVQVVAVTKNVGMEKMREAIEAGLSSFGENRVQEALPKIEAIGKKVSWRMVGHLQSNKVKKAVEYFDAIDSVDSFGLAAEISKAAKAKNRIMPVLLEVNTSGEPSKYGLSPEKTLEEAEKIAGLENLSVDGLMTVGPLANEEKKLRAAFARLRQLFEEIEQKKIFGLLFRHLSMGMSADYPMAVEEGATMVRLGTAIFGPRTQNIENPSASSGFIPRQASG